MSLRLERKPAVSKKRKRAPLHKEYVVPKSFLIDAIEAKEGYQVGAVGEAFGLNGEAYVRQPYEDLLRKFQEAWNESAKNGHSIMAAIIGGSSGVGKSVFLGYLLARYRNETGHLRVAVFFAPKATKSSNGTPKTEEVRCSIWIDGEEVVSGKWNVASQEVERRIPELDLIVMDGCSMPLDLVDFEGAVIVAASLSLYTKNLKDSIVSTYTFVMPPLEEYEAEGLAKVVGVDKATVAENFKYMNGITRYLFEKDFAKKKVHDSVESVSATSIMNMVSSQSSNRQEESYAVHSLVLYMLDAGDYEASPKYELVSRYAEHLVAKKLVYEAMENFKIARLNLRPLSGAEGYAGALFEAYAVRTLQQGGKFSLQRLDAKVLDKELIVPPMKDYIEMTGNCLSEVLVGFDEVHVKDGESWSPRLLWPSTTNFPTFDCFYFHTDGEVYLLQMTIAMHHDLKNSGASNAKKYLDKMFGREKPKKYKAVFVVPKDDARTYEAQKFKGKIGKTVVDMTPHFEQWVIGI